MYIYISSLVKIIENHISSQRLLMPKQFVMTPTKVIWLRYTITNNKKKLEKYLSGLQLCNEKTLDAFTWHKGS